MTERLQGQAAAGRLLAVLLQRLVLAAQPGVPTAELDTLARTYLRDTGTTSNFLDYGGYPFVICTSVNEQVIHGQPNGRALRAGDVLTIDTGLIKDGWHADHATTFIVGGDGTPAAERFLATGQHALDAAIASARPGNRVGDVSAAMQTIIESAGYSAVRDFTGHGIGRAMHEEPSIPCYGHPGKGTLLHEGMVLAIEVMMNQGGSPIRTLKDGWTTVTRDGSLSAQFEHTVALTATGPIILTMADSPDLVAGAGQG